ncbi:hypothetical protein Trydic_g5456 [Trypoxylus dichotomus]
MQKLLDDPTYKPITTDPTIYLAKTTRTKINNAPLSKETKTSIIPRKNSSKCPKMYSSPKIYKLDVPLRPIRYSQTEGTLIGSPLPPIITNIFMEGFKTTTLGTAKYKTMLWLSNQEKGWHLTENDSYQPLPQCANTAPSRTDTRSGENPGVKISDADHIRTESSKIIYYFHARTEPTDTTASVTKGYNGQNRYDITETPNKPYFPPTEKLDKFSIIPRKLQPFSYKPNEQENKGQKRKPQNWRYEQNKQSQV